MHTAFRIVLFNSVFHTVSFVCRDTPRIIDTICKRYAARAFLTGRNWSHTVTSPFARHICCVVQQSVAHFLHIIFVFAGNATLCMLSLASKHAQVDVCVVGLRRHQHGASDPQHFALHTFAIRWQALRVVFAYLAGCSLHVCRRTPPGGRLCRQPSCTPM